MAFISQDTKAKLAPGIKAVLKRYKTKGTIAVRQNRTLVVNINEGPIDFGNTVQVNTYHVDTMYSGTVQKFLSELVEAMRGPDFFDHTDIGTDYFNCSHYVDINIGQWNKPYVRTV